MRFFFCLVIVFVTVDAHAQSAMRDSLARQLMRDSARIYRYTIARPYARLENRNTFFNTAPINFYGAMFGAVFYGRHVVAGGFYFLTPQSRDIVLVPASGIVQQLLRTNFVNFTYQYILVNRRYLQLQVPVEIGYGRYRMNFREEGGPLSIVEGPFIPASLGMQVILRPFAFAGLSLMVGHRFSVQDSNALSLQGEYYAFGVWVDARQILRNIRYWKKKRDYRRAVSGL